MKHFAIITALAVISVLMGFIAGLFVHCLTHNVQASASVFIFGSILIASFMKVYD